MEVTPIAIIGPTACGKTRRAVEVAKHFNGEIISADSRQVYIGMDLGTGKDLDEYESVPYHLIDIESAGEKYNLHRYLKDFNKAWELILRKGRTPIVCGGTGLYVESALRGMQLPDVPENPKLRKELQQKTLEELTTILSSFKKLHNTTDVDTVKRAIRAIEIEQYYIDNLEFLAAVHPKEDQKLNCKIIGIDISREDRRERISNRLRQRLEEGMVEEVRNLLLSGIPPENLIYYGLEYKFVTLHVLGQISYSEMFKGLETAIHQFAKRQMTWFRGMEKRGFHINWLPYDLSPEEFISRVSDSINSIQ